MREIRREFPVSVVSDFGRFRIRSFRFPSFTETPSTRYFRLLGSFDTELDWDAVLCATRPVAELAIAIGHPTQINLYQTTILDVTGWDDFPPIENSHIFMINSMLNHVALLKPPLLQLNVELVLVMVYYQKLFRRCSQHWTGGGGDKVCFVNVQ
jgi:hypothetical protein